MKVLITGGCGFIGTNLISFLLQKGVSDIRVIDNLSVGSRKSLSDVCEFQSISVEEAMSNPPKDVELVVVDIMDTESALKVCNGVDAIVHLAANTGVGPSVENPMFDCRSNVLGTLNYLEGARENNIGNFVFASSGAPAGEVTPPIHEEIVPKPVSPYGASKLAGEGYCSSYFKCFGINTVALRFGNVYGPRSVHKSSVVAKFINLARANEPLEIYGDGSQTRDFIYIEDLIKAIHLSLTTDAIGGEVFQIATSKETTVADLVDEIVDVMTDAGIAKPSVTYTEKRVGDVMRNYSDTSKAKKRLNWTAETTLKNGLKKTLQYFIEQGEGK